MIPFNLSGEVYTISELEDVRIRAIRGGGVAILSQALVFGLQMVGTVILARLLTAVDFGLITMVTTVCLLLTSFGLNGFSEAVLQKEELNRSLMSNLFWINLGASTLIAVAFAGAGGLLARFYSEPRISGVTVGMSVTIVLTSMSVQHLALLRRAMCFTAVSILDIIARAVSVVASIGFALTGWGYWALVAGAIAYPLINTIGAWSLCRWIPGRPSRAAGTAATVWYASHVYGHFTVSYLARNMDNVLVGWRFSPAALGYYKKAYDLFALSASQLIAPLTVVAVASLSRLKNDAPEYRRYFRSALEAVGLVGMGLGAVLNLIGSDLVRMLLGPRWGPAAEIFRFFGPGIGAMLIYNMHGWIHLSIGTPQRWFRWGIIEFLITSALFIVGLAWGPVGVAAAWTISSIILIVPAFWYAGKPIDLGVGTIVAAVWRYAAATVIAAAVTAVLGRVTSFFAEASQTWAGAAGHAVKVSLLFGTLYFAAIVVLHGGIKPLVQFMAVVKVMIPWNRVAESSRAVSLAAAE